MRHHADARREFWGDIFATREGDINLVRPAKGVFIGWHRHQQQDDRLFLVSGVLRLRVFETTPQADGIEWILAETADRTPVVIPRQTWHGYEALTTDCIIMQFNGPRGWDGTDEERLSLDAMPWPR